MMTVRSLSISRNFVFLVMTAATAAAVAGCDGGSDGGTDPADEDFGGPPAISEVLPHVAVSGGYIYVEGEHLATPGGLVEGVTIEIDGADASGAAVTVDLRIDEGKPERLTAEVPVDMDTRIQGAGSLRVTTPEGSAEFPSPIFAVKDSGFGGAAGRGEGMVGNVYAVLPQTPALPDFTDPCKDPQVISSGAFTCPHTIILVPNLDVPVRSFTEGFPGLGDNLLEWFAIEFTGYLVVEKGGSYTFQSCSDDASNVYIVEKAGATKVVDNDGLHGMSCKSGSIDLKAGTYPIIVDYMQGPATEIGMQLYWTPPGGVSEIIPASNLRLFVD